MEPTPLFPIIGTKGSVPFVPTGITGFYVV